ncbi:MAG TPA: hypothetical protein VI752_01220 [Candidatus Paceibacterota bacterium]
MKKIIYHLKFLFPIILGLIIFYLFFGFGVHKAYVYTVTYVDGNTKEAYTKNPEITMSTAYYDYEEEKLKAKSLWFIGRYYQPICFAFGCGNTPKVDIWIPIVSSEKEFPNDCFLKYYDIKETEQWLMSQFPDQYKEGGFINDEKGYGFKYNVTCESGIEAESRIGLEKSLELYHWGYIDFYDPEDNIVQTYPTTLGLLIKKGYSLPTFDNRVIKLGK